MPTCVSLGHAFAAEFLIGQNSVKQAFALTLYSRFPTGMSLPLSTSDIFSEVYRPSQTVRLLMFPSRDKQYALGRVVLHDRLNFPWRENIEASYLHSTTELTPQQQITVKLYGVYSSH